jgi:hypothetical protein
MHAHVHKYTHTHTHNKNAHTGIQKDDISNVILQEEMPEVEKLSREACPFDVGACGLGRKLLGPGYYVPVSVSHQG